MLCTNACFKLKKTEFRVSPPVTESFSSFRGMKSTMNCVFEGNFAQWNYVV